MKEYITSCNPLTFDIVSHFANNKEVIWRQNKACEPNDIFYIYVGRPFSCLKYICRVIESNIPFEDIQFEFYRQQAITKRNINKPYMKLELLKEMDGKNLTLDDLLDHGLKTVQCTTEVSTELSMYIKRTIKQGKL